MTKCSKINDFRRFVFKIHLLVGVVLIFSFNSIFAQSTNQNSPTPLVTNEIQGRINARDIGDSRLTGYYFVFNGERGDVFINVVTDNFNGDIDIFTADNLEPRTKITVYADGSNTETGRIIYMRKPEKLILRIQGRTPNDDPGTFYIKFAGSFKPMITADISENVETPKVEVERSGTVRVNSVGTIIEEPETERTDDKVESNLGRSRISDVDKSDDSAIPEKFDPTKKPVRTLLGGELKAESKDTNSDKTDSEKDESDITVSIGDSPKSSSTIVRIERSDDEEDNETELTAKEAEEAKILEKLELKIKLKTGTKFEKAMNEVISINVIKTVLTIVTTDGKIHEFSIFDVAKMSID